MNSILAFGLATMLLGPGGGFATEVAMGAAQADDGPDLVAQMSWSDLRPILDPRLAQLELPALPETASPNARATSQPLRRPTLSDVDVANVDDPFVPPTRK